MESPVEAQLLAPSGPAIHRLYGVAIRSPWPLANVPPGSDPQWDIEFIEGNPSTFARAIPCIPARLRGRWYQSTGLPDGSAFCRWLGLFEFIVRPGARRIEVLRHKHVSDEGLQAYLLNQALSFSMVALGREPLHATAIETDRGVVAFMGDGGFGKSTLGALMVQGGARLVTDDMFVVARDEEKFSVFPGPPRLKLYRHVADGIFGDRYSGVPMNPVTQKVIIPLSREQCSSQPRPLRAIYVISEPGSLVASTRIDRLSASEAFPILLGATLNDWMTDDARLERLFRFAGDLARTIPIKRLAFPRAEERMFALRDTIFADVATIG